MRNSPRVARKWDQLDIRVQLYIRVQDRNGQATAVEDQWLYVQEGEPSDDLEGPAGGVDELPDEGAPVVGLGLGAFGLPPPPAMAFSARALPRSLHAAVCST